MAGQRFVGRRGLLGTPASETEVRLADKTKAANELVRKAQERGQKLRFGEALRRIDQAAQEREALMRKRKAGQR